MIGGWDSFDAVLDRVGKEQADGSSAAAGPWAAMRGWNSSFIAASLKPQPWPSREPRAEAASVAQTKPSAAARPESVPEPAPEPVPEPVIDTTPFKRLSPEQVAKDINLLASDTSAELKSKRRRFARLNHPDRVPVEWRQAATTRMKIANHMVDEALRRL